MLCMSRLKNGDDLALNEIMGRWQNPLVSFLLRYAGNARDALRQRFAGLRMMIPAQREKSIAPHIAMQSECPAPLPNHCPRIFAPSL